MGVLVRIILRYLAMFLVAKGFFSPDLGNTFATDPDILMAAQVIIGGVVAVLAEGWYWVARKYGWAT